MSGIILNIRVIPKAAKNEVIKLDKKNWKVKVTAAAVEGKANEALIKLLAKEFGVAKSQVEIVRGKRGRDKVIRVKNYEPRILYYFELRNYD
jgi:uncharacterized protein (TIGR00251 family)